MAINLLTADVVEMEKIPGLGRERAERIVEARDQGNLNSWDDLKKLPDFPEQLLNDLRRTGVQVGSAEGGT